MADWLPSELIILYQDAFQLVDSDNDGVITTKMLGKLLRQCGENPSESEIQDLVNDVDSDASGFLHFPAFLAMMSKKYMELNAEDEIREAFRVFDSDGNGFITRQELKVVMMHMGEKLSDEEIESIIDDADMDADGQINYEEFYIMMNSVK